MWCGMGGGLLYIIVLRVLDNGWSGAEVGGRGMRCVVPCCIYGWPYLAGLTCCKGGVAKDGRWERNRRLWKRSDGGGDDNVKHVNRYDIPNQTYRIWHA